MNTVIDKDALQPMRIFFNSGATKTVAFRLEQLKKLKTAIVKYQDAIGDALYTDLKKSAEEAYSTETGLLLAEINLTIKNLRNWMEPVATATNLVNLPSSTKMYRDALGIVFIIAPWNYPFQLLLIPLVGAIAGGNCAVLKPSELAPATAGIIQKIIEAVFPEQYIKVVQGEGAAVVPQLITSFHFDHIFYTGSIPVGKIIYKLAAEKLIPVTLELGGKSPAIVEADANIPVTARRIVLGKFINCGQTCIAPDYLLVHHSVKKELVNEIIKCITAFYGSNSKNSCDYGKIINEKRFDTLVAYLQNAVILFGGEYDRALLFIAPTLLDEPIQDSPIMTEEIFGPLLPVISFSNFEQVAAIVEQHANPLAFYLFTASKQKEKEWISRIPFGGGCINNTAWHFANHHIPFGGVGNSGLGAYHGKYSFDTFTRLKAVMKTPTWFDPNIKYPSFKGKLKLF